MAMVAARYILATVLDAQGECLRAADQLLANEASASAADVDQARWMLGHVAATQANWIGSYVCGMGSPGRSLDMVEGVAQVSLKAAHEDVARLLADLRGRLAAFDDARLDEPGLAPSSSFLAGWTKGQILLRSAVHVFGHAADLNGLAVSAGSDDLDLPGDMPHLRSVR